MPAQHGMLCKVKQMTKTLSWVAAPAALCHLNTIESLTWEGWMMACCENIVLAARK
jgi:hypothetical protein